VPCKQAIGLTVGKAEATAAFDTRHVHAPDADLAIGCVPSPVARSRRDPPPAASWSQPMSFLAWIILGLIAGFIGSRIVNSTGQGLIVDIALGIVGAVVGGFLFHQFGEPGVSGLNLYSLLVATVGAVVVLWLYHALVGRRVV
jgi:uncharacterized membrane protein YeaQ/YmgE (transglycosylase-associated protein family)